MAVLLRGFRLSALAAVLALVAAVFIPAAAADNYRGTNPDYSTKIRIYNSSVAQVKGVRVGRTYTFVLEAFGSDVDFAYMCVKVASRDWKCRDTIAAGTLRARIYDSFGTDFKITPQMISRGTVTVRALDLLKKPLVTRVVPVASSSLAKVSFTGHLGRNDAGVRSWVLRVIAPGENIDDFSVCWKQKTGERCTNALDGLGTYITYIAEPRVDYAIPMYDKNVVGGKFQAWLMFDGKRVKSFSIGA